MLVVRAPSGKRTSLGSSSTGRRGVVTARPGLGKREENPAPRPRRYTARMGRLWRYLGGLSAGRFALWCYFLWWTVVLVRYFDPNPRLWLTSLGLAVIIGAALYVNTTRSGTARVRLEPWPAFRLFLTPFCVSSFAALVKDRGFWLVFSPRWEETAAAAGACAALGALALAARKR
jgi:hypothetical protein